MSVRLICEKSFNYILRPLNLANLNIVLKSGCEITIHQNLHTESIQIFEVSCTAWEWPLRHCLHCFRFILIQITMVALKGQTIQTFWNWSNIWNHFQNDFNIFPKWFKFFTKKFYILKNYTFSQNNTFWKCFNIAKKAQHFENDLNFWKRYNIKF